MTAVQSYPRTKSDRCYIGLPKWLWSSVIAPVVVSSFCGAFLWAWSTDRTTEKHAEQIQRVSDEVKDLKGDVRDMGKEFNEKLDQVLRHVKQL